MPDPEVEGWRASRCDQAGFLTCEIIAFSATFMLITALNPCPCGYRGDSEKSCSCSASVVARSGTLWVKRISGPLLDRIDIHVEVPRVNYEKLSGTRQGEPS